MSRKRLPVWRTLLVMVNDLLAVALGLLLAYWLRFHSPLKNVIHIRGGFIAQDYLNVFPWACLIWLIALRLENLYRRRARVIDKLILRRIVSGSILAVLVMIAINYGPDRPTYSRVLLVLMLGVVISALVLGRLVLDRFFRWMIIHRGVGQSRTLIIGTGPLAEHICRSLMRHPERGMLPIGFLMGRAGEIAPAEIAGLPVFGSIDDLANVAAAERVDEAILAQPLIDRERLPDLLLQCERALVDFTIVPETTELLLSGMTVETIDGIAMLGTRDTPLQGWNAALKRLIDFILAFIGLVFAAPVIGLLAFLIKRQDGGPAFYKQERMGIDGQLFHIFKLRTMSLDAEREGPSFATDYDPRATRLGAILRRLHIDELPQLVNVVRGEMSLVGPRPERPFFIEKFLDSVPGYMSRHKVKSGITGWAQVNGLCGLHGSIDERLKYDMYYIEHWSVWFDVKIIFMTLFKKPVTLTKPQ